MPFGLFGCDVVCGTQILSGPHREASGVDGHAAGSPPNLLPVDDLEREVYCILGMPIDAVDLETVLGRIDAAARSKAPFLISTPNLNFLVNSRSDAEFRESLLRSDLCPAD